MAHTRMAELCSTPKQAGCTPPVLGQLLSCTTITQRSASWQEPQRTATYLLQNVLGVLCSQSILKCQTYTQHRLHQENPPYRAPTAPTLTPKCVPSSGCPVDNEEPTSILANKHGQGLGWDNGTQCLSCEFSALLPGMNLSQANYCFPKWCLDIVSGSVQAQGPSCFWTWPVCSGEWKDLTVGQELLHPSWHRARLPVCFYLLV